MYDGYYRRQDNGETSAVNTRPKCLSNILDSAASQPAPRKHQALYKFPSVFHFLLEKSIISCFAFYILNMLKERTCYMYIEMVSNVCNNRLGHTKTDSIVPESLMILASDACFMYIIC